MTIHPLLERTNMRNLQTPSFRFAGPALCALSLFLSASQAQPSVDYYPPKPQAVATFESIGITWMLGGHNTEVTVEVRYRPEGANAWNEAMPLWYDARDGEARGSIVNLTPGETYQIELRWQEEEATARFSANTWEETFPIAKTVTSLSAYFSAMMRLVSLMIFALESPANPLFEVMGIKRTLSISRTSV